MKTDAAPKSEFHRLLATCYAEDAKPELDKALAENALYLADKNLSPADRQEGLLTRAGYLFRLHRTADCLALLDQIPPAAGLGGRATLLRGQILYEEAQTLLAKSTATAERAPPRAAQIGPGHRGLPPGAEPRYGQQPGYPAGDVPHGALPGRVGRPPRRLEQLERTAKLFAGYPEALAATLQEAELSRQAKRDADALAAYRHVLGAITDPESFHNPWMTLEQLRGCVLAAYRGYLEARNFQMALQLSRMFYPLLPKTQVLELTAAVHTRWAQALLDEAGHVSIEKGQWLAHLGRAQWRQAGGVYLRLAQLELSDRQYPERLWTSANAYFQGQDYRNAARILQNYVKNEMRRRHPQALLTLGQALLAMNEAERALAAFEECVLDHPRDAAAYHARLLAAAIHAEKGRNQQAESLLQENLTGEHLTPDSQEWRDSLFAFGALLHTEGRYAEAARRLEEFVHRYPDASQGPAAHYLIADSYRQGGQALQEGASAGGGAAALRRAAEAMQLREKALAEYQGLVASLGNRDDRDLTAPGAGHAPQQPVRRRPVGDGSAGI